MKYFLYLLAFLFVIDSYSQIDSLELKTKQKSTFLKKSIIPLSLIGTGLFINYSNGTFGKKNLQDQIQSNFSDFHTNIDDYLLFIPVVAMYSADILNVKSKNDPFTQTKYLAISGIINHAIVYGLKRVTNEERPNGKDYSFPSGHTSNAFVMATVLHNEFIDTNAFLAYSGYLFATATGILRVLNNEHWVSDVLVGAGIGILVTNLVYKYKPLKNWNPFKRKNTNAFISPTFGRNQIGLYANIQF